MYNASQFEKPDSPYSVVKASDGSSWYQTAQGANALSYYDAPQFTGSASEASGVSSAFPDAEQGTTLRTVGDGVMEASTENGNTLWYNSAYYEEPEAPHTVMQSANGVEWYAMQQHAQMPEFETGEAPPSPGGTQPPGQSEAAFAYNRAQFQTFMPGYEQNVTSIDASAKTEGHFEVRHEDGTGTRFYDTAAYSAPKGDYKVYEDAKGGQWYAVHGEPAVERRPVYENGKAVYDGDRLRTVASETVRYRNTPARYERPKRRNENDVKPPKRKRS